MAFIMNIVFCGLLCLGFTSSAPTSASASASASCSQPSDATLHAQWADMMGLPALPESFYHVDIYRNLIIDHLAAGASSPSTEIHLYGDQDSSHCSKSDIEAGKALMDRSYCPWYNIISYNENRYPRDMAEARCRCTYGAGMGTASACEHVYFNKRVLRNTGECEDGVYVYKAGWQQVAVGCTLTQAV